MAQQNMTAVEWLIDQLRQLAHNPSTHLGMGDIRITQGMLDDFEEKAKHMEKEQLDNARPQIVSNCVIKEISDEEIEDVSGGDVSFEFGAKWYREQLKKKQL